MGRYTGPACRQCRREGVKLFLKGERCYMAKCAIEVGRPAPGMHGATRKRKLSDYGVQLSAKQRIRKSFGLREVSFRGIFDRALRKKGVTGDTLLQLLEMRLDNLTYRLGFAASRRAARQMVRHRHVSVNGKIATIPAMVLKPDDVVAVRAESPLREWAKQTMEATETRGIPSWLALDKEGFSGKVLRVPSRSEISPIANEQLVVELYSK